MKMLQNVREVLKSLKHRKQATIYCCPRCRSPKITLHSSLDLWLTPKKYVCQNCGYTGPIILELEKIEDEAPSPAAQDSTASSASCSDSAR